MSLKLIFYFSYSTLCTVKLGNKERFDKEQIGISGKSFSEAILTSTNAHYDKRLELVSKELNHLAAILHVYAGGLNFMK